MKLEPIPESDQPLNQEELKRIQLLEEEEDLKFEAELMKLTPRERIDLSVKPLDPTERIICRLYAIGTPIRQIAEQVGMGTAKVRKTIKQENAREFLSKLYGELDQELQSLWGLTIEKIRKGLNNADPHVYLAAAALYGRFAGKFTQKISLHTSAEDVVKQLMDGEDVNVGAPSQTSSGTALQDPEQEG